VTQKGTVRDEGFSDAWHEPLTAQGVYAFTAIASAGARETGIGIAPFRIIEM
jgi:hypothetical protein